LFSASGKAQLLHQLEVVCAMPVIGDPAAGDAMDRGGEEIDGVSLPPAGQPADPGAPCARSGGGLRSGSALRGRAARYGQ
jgi:hypothetical protein